MALIWYLILGMIGMIAVSAIRIIPPTHRAVIERLGKYHRFATPGLHFVIPVIDRIRQRDITERMVDASKQEIITKDHLNAVVNAQVYYKARIDEAGVMASFYNVSNLDWNTVNLTQTTLRNVIGNMELMEANAKRESINEQLVTILRKETENWGIEIVRAELQEIKPPHDIQETMNQVVRASNEKLAAVDFATAEETRADGQRRAKIKLAEAERQTRVLEAEGLAKSIILEAESRASAIKLENEAADKYFVGNAQLLKRLETTERALGDNMKLIIPHDSNLINMVGDWSGIKPVPVVFPKEER